MNKGGMVIEGLYRRKSSWTCKLHYWNEVNC